LKRTGPYAHRRGRIFPMKGDLCREASRSLPLL